MRKKSYDTFIIGHISKDEIIDNGKVTKSIGGAVLHSSYAAAAGGFITGILTKTTEREMYLLKEFNISEEHIYHVLSKETTSIRSEFLTVDKETRICTALSIADQFTLNDIPKVESRIYYLAGLIIGDYDNEIIKYLSEKGKIALDVQGFLRSPENGNLVYRDWEEKKEYLPYADFLKTDAVEAKVLTGTENRYEAAKILYNMGAREVMITHNTEVIAYDGRDFYCVPLKPRNLTGRTGRGDTCFSAYVAERLNKGPGDALLYAAALVSLKIETPGPFTGSRNDVEDYIRLFYNM